MDPFLAQLIDSYDVGDRLQVKPVSKLTIRKWFDKLDQNQKCFMLHTIEFMDPGRIIRMDKGSLIDLDVLSDVTLCAITELAEYWLT